MFLPFQLESKENSDAKRKSILMISINQSINQSKTDVFENIATYQKIENYLLQCCYEHLRIYDKLSHY